MAGGGRKMHNMGSLEEWKNKAAELGYRLNHMDHWINAMDHRDRVAGQWRTQEIADGLHTRQNWMYIPDWASTSPPQSQKPC